MRPVKCEMGDEPRFCVGMGRCLGEPFTKGLSCLHTIDLSKDGPSAKMQCTGIVYRTGARDKGLMLNSCPWCGADLTTQFKKSPKSRAEEARASREPRQ